MMTNVLNFDLLVIELELQFQYFKVKYEQHEFSWDMPFQNKSLHCISDKEILHLLILTHLCSSPFDENGTSSDNSHTRSFNVFDQHEKQLSIRHGRYADTINIKHINPKKKNTSHLKPIPDTTKTSATATPAKQIKTDHFPNNFKCTLFKIRFCFSDFLHFFMHFKITYFTGWEKWEGYFLLAHNLLHTTSPDA